MAKPPQQSGFSGTTLDSMRSMLGQNQGSSIAGISSMFGGGPGMGIGGGGAQIPDTLGPGGEFGAFAAQYGFDLSKLDQNSDIYRQLLQMWMAQKTQMLNDWRDKINQRPGNVGARGRG